MRAAWDAKNRLLALGVPLEFALYVLPNAKTLRMVESGSLLALMHKWLMRTCFNAQEEIYLASMDELDAVRLLHPRLARFIGPPCVVRNGLIAPRCTEGTHFCGDPRLARLPGRGAAALMSAPWRFEHELEVRFRDCDPMGHVNNAVYLTYLESARFAWWRSAFGPLGLKEHGFIVARVEIDYRKPALAGRPAAHQAARRQHRPIELRGRVRDRQREDARTGGRGEERPGRLRLLRRAEPSLCPRPSGPASSNTSRAARPIR